MKTVAQILTTKPMQKVASVAPGTSARDAAIKMAELGIGALLVMDGDRIVGIVSERDLAHQVVAAGRSASQVRVEDVMTRDVLYVETSHTNEECMALMTRSRLRHLPVLQEGKLVGLVSIGDLVKDLISEQQFIIEQLESYIAGEIA
jgi:signal-transduction protein with cAMP-binding, CBS, and nucleotidyltransferase domain